MRAITASGAIIVENRMLLVVKDKKDKFYKIPGGTVKKGERLETCCLRELKEETGYSAVIVRPLHTMQLDKNPRTGEKMRITLHHYQCRLTNKSRRYPYTHNGHEVRLLSVSDIDTRRDIAPNIKYLIEKGNIA